MKANTLLIIVIIIIVAIGSIRLLNKTNYEQEMAEDVHSGEPSITLEEGNLRTLDGRKSNIG